MVNRSTYYKFLNHTPSARDKDNAYIRSCILALHSKYKKRLGADKLRICLRNEYCLQISTGRVYRLLKTMNLPKMSTVKPFSRKNAASLDENCINILKQRFNPAKPNAAWVCDMTYLRAAGRTFAEILILRGLFFTLTAALNLLLRFFAIIWTVWIWFNLFRLRGILMTMLLWRVFQVFEEGGDWQAFVCFF